MEMQLEPLGAELRFSRVAPDLENNLSKVSELVQLMRSGGAGLTDTQATRLVGYLGSLEDMRNQIGVIAQRYEDDDNVLRKLTMLLDRIDESLRIIHYNNEGYSKEDISDQEKEEEVVVEKALHNSLMVSTTHVLGISGLLLPRLFEDLAVHAEEVDDNEDGEFWDPPLTEADIACLDITSNTNTQVPLNLSASFMESDPSEVPSPTNLRASNTDQASESSSSNEKKKGKEKMKGTCPPTLCKICYEEFTNWDDLYSLSNCNHTYCKECFTEYLSLQIISGGVLDLSCPNPQCEKEVTITDVHAVCDDETLEKYERFVVLAALRADPDVRWCPVPQCSNPIRGPPTDGSEWVVCSKCQLQVCFACGDERHDPVKCGKEAKELIATRHHAVVEAESAFEEWHKGKPTDVKPCPKCKAFIEKNQGCNHMTCVACKHQFCWLCKADYVYNHFNTDLYPDCKGKQYWYPPVPPDPELQSRYNWIYFPPNYQYEGIEAGPLTPIERIGGRRPRGYSNSEKAGNIAKKVGVYVGVGMAVATLGIPAAIIGGPIYGVFKLHKRLKAKRAYNRRFRQDHIELYS